ncbi:MAG: hypothetical protein AB7E80_07815 [Hyphomicrobiaceae bacterium]
MMRIVVVVLALLAGAKVWTQDQIYRTAAEEALIAAYAGKAVEACRRAELPDMAATRTEASRRLLADAWSTSAHRRVVIGDSSVNVAVWEVEHAAWPLRYRHAYVVMEAGAPDPFARCSYDVKLDRAAIRPI